MHTICPHERCYNCNHIVVPMTRESRLFITKYCPDCGYVISDVAKPGAVYSACIMRKK